MINDIKNLLKTYGLDESEIEVFLATVQIGPQAASFIARKAGINRASAYDVIRRLILMGLVHEISKGKVKRYEAIEPQLILQKLQESRNKIENQIKLFGELKPEINALYGVKFDKPSVSFYEGLEGVKNILLDTIEDPKTREIWSYASADYLKIGFGQDFLDRYWKRRTELKIPTRGIIPGTEEARKIFTDEKNRSELRQVKFVDAGKQFTNEIDIYSNKISIISLDSKNLYGVIIKSENIANTQRSIYELLWDFI